MNIPFGECIQCGSRYFGWALQDESQRVCDCGGDVIVYPDSEEVDEYTSSEPQEVA